MVSSKAANKTESIFARKNDTFYSLGNCRQTDRRIAVENPLHVRLCTIVPLFIYSAAPEVISEYNILPKTTHVHPNILCFDTTFASQLTIV